MHLFPLLRNMHPVHNQEHRQERAKAIYKRFANAKDAIYVDAADYWDRTAMAASANN